MRPPVRLDRPKEASKIEAALKEPVEKRWRLQRLQAMRMAAQGQWSLRQIADAVGAGRSSVAGWLKIVREQGVEVLLQRKEGQGAPGRVEEKVQAAIMAGLREGRWRRARDLQRWLEKDHGIQMGMGGVYYYLGKVGGVLKVPRKTHAKKDAAQGEHFKQTLAEELQRLPLEIGRPVRVWVADEHRFGLISVVRRCWSLRGVRAKAPYHTKYQWGYLHSALEVDGEHGAQALFSSSVNLETSGKFLEQIVQSDPLSQHVVIWDQAGFHPRCGDSIIPAGIHLLSLPPYSPELNPVEKLGSFIKDAVANQVWHTLAAIEDAIAKELRPFWKIPERVKQLIGDNWLSAQLNSFALKQ